MDRRGYFKRSFLDYFFGLHRDPELLKEIEIEVRAQFEETVKSGLAVNHVNGHQHVHMIPSVFEMVCRIMSDYGMKFIRIPSEPFFFSPCFHDTRHMICNLNLLKYLLLRRLSLRALDTMKKFKLGCVGCFVGILYTGRMSLEAFDKAIKKLQQRNLDGAEVLFHPADIDHEKDIHWRGTRVPDYYYLRERKIEKDCLLSDKMREILKDRRIELVNHRLLESCKFRFGPQDLVSCT